MSFEAKVDEVRGVIDEHNKSIGSDSGIILFDKFSHNLKFFGATKEEDLKNLSYEDILICLKPAIFGDTPVEPHGLAKKIASIFRGKETSVDKHITEKKSQKMTERELLDAYNPSVPNYAIEKRLKEISDDKKFIVYSSDNSVDVDKSLELLKEIRLGYESREYVSVEGTPRKVYAVGEMPDKFFDENPFYLGRALRLDGTCDQTGRSWEGISLEVRQFIRLAVQSNTVIANIENIHNTLDMILTAKDPLKSLATRYPEVFIKYEEAKSLGNLPNMKVKLGSESNKGLGKGKRIEW